MLSRAMLLSGFYLLSENVRYVAAILTLTLSLFHNGLDGDLTRLLGHSLDLGISQDTMTDGFKVVVFPALGHDWR
jgi:phosphatidylserine synthase